VADVRHGGLTKPESEQGCVMTAELSNPLCPRPTRRAARWLGVPLTAALGLLVPGPADAQPATTRVSVGFEGAEANHPSGGPAISADGRWVAFDSSASNLVPGDTNDTSDVFMHDRQAGTTTRISVGTGGVEGNGVSHSPKISADGRWVVFDSVASTLVAADTNHVLDVFVHDRLAGTTTRVSVGNGGAQGDSDSRASAISADGRWVAFGSLATNLVPGDSNGESDGGMRAAVRRRSAPTAVGWRSSRWRATWWRTTRMAWQTRSCTTARQRRRRA
jgi:hypothetical protein